MSVQLRVYDPTNTSPQGTLSQAFNIGFLDMLTGPGTLVFSVRAEETTDLALLDPLSVIRVRIDGVDRLAYRVQDDPQEIVALDGARVKFECRHLLADLGYRQAGAALHPYESLDGLQQSPRWFGPMGFDFPTVVRPEPTSGGTLTRENWQDPRAERFVFTSRAVYRRLLTGNATHADKPARMWFTSAAWTEVEVWFDGAPLDALSTPRGDRSIRQYDLPYDGEDHVIMFDCKGTPPAGYQHALGWTWAVLTHDQNGEPNDWGQMENRLFTTFNSTSGIQISAGTPPFWQAWENYADGEYPGVTNGFIAMTAVDEAQARSLLAGMTYDFDADLDSAGVAWEYEYPRAFRPQKLGPLVEALGPWKCEPEMTPVGLLRLFQERGSDKTGSVTVSTPVALSSSGNGPQATRFLYQTNSGFGTATNTAAETALGLKMEDVITLGDDLHPHTIAEAVVLQLAADSDPPDDISIGLPDTLVPYVDIEIGDRVNCRSDVDGTVEPVRITSFAGAVLDTGRIAWSAVASTIPAAIV
jgi:hypothetical protein